MPSTLTSTGANLTGTVNADGSTVNACYFVVIQLPPSGAPYPCQQQVGAGSTPMAVSANLTGLLPATTYTATLVASSEQGTGMGATVTFTTPASPTAGLTGAGGAGAGGTGPAVSNLKLSPARFRRGKHAAKLASQSHSRHHKSSIPVGTSISFALSNAASVTLSFQRAQPGQLAGHSCLAPSSKRRHPHRCTRYTPVSGAITLAAHVGGNQIRFEGILDGNRRLSPGSYRLALVAGDVAGTTMAVQHPTFTLLG
jgi:hypothetical protein